MHPSRWNTGLDQRVFALFFFFLVFPSVVTRYLPTQRSKLYSTLLYSNLLYSGADADANAVAWTWHDAVTRDG